MTQIQLLNPSSKSMETCINEAYKSFNVPKLGGASGDGWSKMSDFQRCPYRYYLLHEPHGMLGEGEVSMPAALEIGSLFHSMLAMHYVGAIPHTARGYDNYTKLYPKPFALAERVLNLGADPLIVEECKRLYIGYYNEYKNPQDEGITPLAVEFIAGRKGIHTCRFDAIVTYQGGTWILEHKTASRESREVIEGWWLDGEIIGEVYGYKLSGLERWFGPLTGVLVNIVIKTKEPKYRRPEVVITEDIVNRYNQDNAYWRTLRSSMREAGFWPRKLQGCISRYDTCAFWDHCSNAATADDERLNRLLKLSLER